MSNYRLAIAALALLAAPAYAAIQTITGDLHGSDNSIDNDIPTSTPTGDNTNAAAAAAAAATESSSDIISGAINGNACPNNQINFSNGGSQSYCCPGAVYGEQDDNPFCCVGADFEVARPTFASCFPTCSGTTQDSGVSSTTSQACSTTIYMSDSNYSSLAQAAATSLSSERSSSNGMGSSASSTGGSPSSNGASPSSTSGSSSGQSAASSSAASLTNSEGAAASLMASGPMAGALVAAGGLIMAL